MAEAISAGASEVGPVLITGASGFLGSALVDVFRRAGFPVRILVRATSPRRNLTWTDVEIVEGDMRDPAAVAAAMRGQRYLIHAAADYRLWAPDTEEIVRTNRDGTRADDARGPGGRASSASSTRRASRRSSRRRDGVTPVRRDRAADARRPPSAPTSAARSWPSGVVDEMVAGTACRR